MAGVSYRDLQKADYESIIQLINITWEFEQFISGAKTLHRIIHLLLMGSLLTSSYGKVAIMDGHVVGFILGRAEKDKKRLLKKHN